MDNDLTNHNNSISSLYFFNIVTFSHKSSPLFSTPSCKLSRMYSFSPFCWKVKGDKMTWHYLRARQWQNYNLTTCLLKLNARLLPLPGLLSTPFTGVYIDPVEGTKNQVPCLCLQCLWLSGNHSNRRSPCGKWDHPVHTCSVELSYKRRGVFHRGPLSLEFPSPGQTQPLSIGLLGLHKPHQVELGSCDW